MPSDPSSFLSRAFRLFFLPSLFWRFVMMVLAVSLVHSLCSTWGHLLIRMPGPSVHCCLFYHIFLLCSYFLQLLFTGCQNWIDSLSFSLLLSPSLYPFVFFSGSNFISQSLCWIFILKFISQFNLRELFYVFNNSFNKYLCRISCVPHTVLGDRDMAVNKDKNLCS